MKETERIVETAEQKGIILRLFGGMAIRFHCESATHRSLQRKYADIDFMGLRKQAGEIKKFFPEIGYAPREIFNAMSQNRRFIFNDIAQGRRVDIFLDTFQMCHEFDFRDRLKLDKPTIPLADLLATKLQVFEISEREYRDIIALLHDHELGNSDSHEVINAEYLAKMCAQDWGVYKTFTLNLDRIRKSLPEYQLEADYREIVQKRLDDLTARFENVPKSMGWRMRAKIGEKKQWYQLPERDKEIIDSRSYGERTKMQ
jgi:hypothetical protein